MPYEHPDEVDATAAALFLTAELGLTVTGVTLLGEGAWSRCFAFRSDGEDLVIRFGRHLEDFRKDDRAQRYSRPGLPVPELRSIGAAGTGWYAISTRSFGTPLEHATASEWASLLPSVTAMFSALNSCTVPATAGWGGWDEDGVAGHGTWREALLTVAEDRPGRTHGWRTNLARHDAGADAFRWGLALLDETASDAVPHGLIHSDLLNRNVHVIGSEITGVFDWGCATYGDPLYELAWFQFWAPWYPQLDFDALATAVLATDTAGGHRDRLMAAAMHIGLGHLAYGAFRDAPGNITEVAERMLAVTGKN